MNDSRGHHDELCKRTIATVVTAGDAEYLSAVAQVHVTAPTVAAFAAIHSGIESDAVAFREAIYAGADFGNCPRGFVTHHQRRYAPSGRAVITVNVAAANSTRRHTDQNFVAIGRWNRQVGDLELAVLREEKSFHLSIQECVMADRSQLRPVRSRIYLTRLLADHDGHCEAGSLSFAPR
jgi:hypothetical protein